VYLWESLVVFKDRRPFPDVHTISAAENTEGDIFEKNIAKPHAHPVPIEV